MEFLFAFAAGLLTLINPCVVPVLPIVLTSSLQASRQGPLALAAGMSLSFVVLGMAVTTFGYAIGLTPETLSQAGAVMMIFFGAVLMVPRLSNVFSHATAGVAARADSGIDTLNHASLSGQFFGGLLLGAVWSPCIGPTLGGAISLASQGESLLRATLIMMAFAAGVSSLILALGYGARSALQRRQALMRRIAETSRPLMGAVFLATGLALFFNLHHGVEAWLIGVMPNWLLDLSVTF